MSTPDSADWRALLAAPPSAVDPRGLALGMELRRRTRRDGSAWGPTRFETATAGGLDPSAEFALGLRPLVRSTRSDAWIKGSVSWDALRRPGTPYDRDQARWFVELYSIVRDARTLGTMPDASEWLLLDDVESHLLWPHLAAMANLGIPLRPTKPAHRVQQAREAAVTLRAVRRGADLALEAQVVIDAAAADAGMTRPIGHIGVYRFALDGDVVALTFGAATLTDPLPAMLRARRPVVVPAGDADEFVREHLPALTRRTTVELGPGVPRPAIVPPHLEVAARFSPGDRVEVAMTWRHPGVPPAPYDAVPPAGCDGAFEDDVRGRVAAAWQNATALPFTADGRFIGADAAEFSDAVLPALTALADVRTVVTGPRRAYRELTGDPQITVTTVETDDPDWFDLGVLVTIDGRRIPLAPLLRALTLRRHRMLLSDGDHFSLAHPALDRLRELIDEAGALDEWETGPRLSRYQTTLWADFEDLADQAEPAVTWRAAVAALRGTSAVPATPPPAGLQAALRPYQQTGYDWLTFLWRHRLGGILADDMGLGKTLQTLALIAHAREAGERRPFLVVAPTSVLATWRSESEHFTPHLTVQTIAATARTRAETIADVAAEADVVVTSYALLRLDGAQYAAVRWAGLILDEAQFVKNPATRVHRAARDLDADVTFAITGTPLENSLTDLHALLSLTAPGLFPSAARFRVEYVLPIEGGKTPENAEGGPSRAVRLQRLRRRIRPFVLRRTKDLVAGDLPARQEQDLQVRLGDGHRELYDTVLQRERQKVLGLLTDLDRNRFIVFRSLTLLRMLSLAPALIDGRHARLGSAKLDALVEHVSELATEGHRALVFSQFTSFLQLAARRLDAAGIPYVWLDGSTRRREEVVARFRDGDAPVFLISLKAGGFGLTLVEADYVFLLDPWWNPAAEAQAVDRTHRIGQTRPVNVYRLIAEDTIEHKVRALQERKARLFHSVLDDGDLLASALDADDIRSLFEA
ncbi:DEAD/DEAH box helicase [Microbacterium sp. zg.Y1090]|uniref:DEAD/DEAH box helicase n=1 Tax=Microbacterium TaxID=33882 RepID=UPI00214BD8B2|nr:MULTISPECIES: DEAD/DEAH box helicase [unclassified Microbacterium]MCR2811897.1 DEAD/DEAH box helicase [Microbacterium sp. zg.Y1084]MCR2818664.1 DEAD/DEAH box helicase [Microbacterium sp. zg.Y1090]MDL5486477.1 DEAD/DEAH box helicase [Microbacterium sp. zg-Y1211]WIM29661.1 DEAD/DEAH box helicase [Microbacterium sp. zg-Y1090]